MYRRNPILQMLVEEALPFNYKCVSIFSRKERWNLIMNILGVSYNGNVQNAEWKSVDSLQCERNQG